MAAGASTKAPTIHSLLFSDVEEDNMHQGRHSRSLVVADLVQTEGVAVRLRIHSILDSVQFQH